MLEVQAIVQALEYRDSSVCERLDSLSSIILCSIFFYSQECLAQQRGLCLLAVGMLTTYSLTVTHGVQKALHQDSAHGAGSKLEKKIAIGEAALTLLIKGFVNIDASDRLRRWVSIICCPNGLELTLASLGYLLWNFSNNAPRIQGSYGQIPQQKDTGELGSEWSLSKTSLTFVGNISARLSSTEGAKS